MPEPNDALHNIAIIGVSSDLPTNLQCRRGTFFCNANVTMLQNYMLQPGIFFFALSIVPVAYGLIVV